MRALLSPKLSCEASADRRVVSILLAIVFSVASAVPLAGQEPPFRTPPVKPAPSRQPTWGQPQPGQPAWDQQPGKPARGQPTPDKHEWGQPTPDKHGWIKPTPDKHGWIKPTPDKHGWVHPTPPVSPWRIILGALVVVAFIVWRLRRQKEKKNHLRHPTKAEVVPVMDYGAQHVIPRPPVLAVELCPVLDPGNQTLDKVGPLEQRGGQWTSNLQR